MPGNKLNCERMARPLVAVAMLLAAASAAVRAGEPAETTAANGPATADEAPPKRLRSDEFAAMRTMGRRLTVYEPIYFIAGGDAPEAKFQLSFKYQLATLKHAAN